MPKRFSYKLDNTKLFLSDTSYTLIEKTTYSHIAMSFDSSIQERVSSCILYKEHIEGIYQFVKEG